MTKNPIVKVNVSRLKQDLREKLDNIDANVEQNVYDGFYESRLRIEMSMWKKGKAINIYFTGVNYKVVNYAKLSREVERSVISLKKWHKLYLKHTDKKAYRQIAEEKAQSWTSKVFDKMGSFLEDAKPKQLPESKFKSHVNAILKLMDDDEIECTGKLKELRQLLNKIKENE